MIEYAQLRAGAHLPAPSVRFGSEQHSEENLARMDVPFVKSELVVRKAGTHSRSQRNDVSTLEMGTWTVEAVISRGSSLGK